MVKDFSILLKQPPSTLGLFDSGIGGISILNHLFTLPILNFVYVADTAHLPYGEKTAQFLLERARTLTHYFKDLGITTIVIACHTSAATTLTALEKEFPEITFIDPLPMTTQAALAQTKNGRIGVMATERSIATGMHKKLLLGQNSSVSVIEQACPRFVSLIEHGGSQKEIIQAVQHYTQPLRNQDVDTVILGCTHYPFLTEEIQQALPTVQLISAGMCMSEEIKKHHHELALPLAQHVEFVISGPLEKAQELIATYIHKEPHRLISIKKLQS